ncbi:MAG: hypothetical protein ACRCZF_02070 [Gemmataceae bacterium]
MQSRGLWAFIVLAVGGAVGTATIVFLKPAPGTAPVATVAATEPTLAPNDTTATAPPAELPRLLQKLQNPDPIIRVAALVELGQKPDERSVSDEQLFRWLHDTEPQIRQLCEGVLVARGRSPEEVQFGRKLTHPDVRERLSLLVDLRDADGTVRDLNPWLQRLSQDVDPAVRAGAARVAMECRVRFAEWVNEMAKNDPDPSVRRVAAYYVANPGDRDENSNP